MFIQLLFSRELTWYCRQRSNQDRRRLSPSGFCNKNILNIIPLSSSMCATNIIVTLSYDFIWIIWWYRVLSHGQAKLKSVDSTPAIIKSAIVKVTILSENRDWTISTIFLRRPPPWQTPRALSNTTLSSCSSQTTEEPSMPLNCRSISIMTLLNFIYYTY